MTHASGRRRGATRATVAVPLLIGALALFLRVWAPGPTTQTTDERVWMIRSRVFNVAITHHDFDHATAWGAVPNLTDPTMPGVTTMWAGMLGRNLARWGHEVGFNALPTTTSDGSPEVLRAGRAVVSVACSLALVVLVWLAARLVGRRAAWTAGVLIAVEPWLVGNSGVLHTDAMVTMFGAVSLLAMAAALAPTDPPAPVATATDRPARQVRRPALDVDIFLFVLSWGFGALALLTKLNAFALLGPGLVIVVLADAWQRGRAGTDRPSRLLGRALALGALWSFLAAVVFVALWPAMWVSPLAQISHMRAALHQLDGYHTQFFRGQADDDPGRLFYPFVLWFRLSPWLLICSVATFVALAARPFARLAHRDRLAERLPAIPGWILLVTVPYLMAIYAAEKKLDRYILPALPFLAIISGVGVAALVDAVSDRVGGRG